MNHKNNTAIILMISVAFFQAFMSTIAKSVSPFITTSIQVLSYYIIPLIFFLFHVLNKKSDYKINRHFFYLCLVRGFFSSASVFLFFYSAQKIPIGIATIFFNTTPIFVPVLAYLFLNEKCSWKVWLGIFVSLTGVILIIKPGAHDFISIYSILGLCSGFFMALSQVMLRNLTKNKISTPTIVFYQYLTSAFFSVIFILTDVLFSTDFQKIFAVSQEKITFVFIMLSVLGLISIVAQIFLTKAFKYQQAAKLTPFLYISIPISCFLGWYFWNQTISSIVIAGTILIVLGNYIVSFNNTFSFKKLFQAN